MDKTDHAFTPSNTDQKVNRKFNRIIGLPNHPHASARFPTVSFDNENKSTPTGKAWLATLPSEQAIEAVLKKGFKDSAKYGPNAIRDLEQFVKELKSTARRGFGIAVNEAEPGVTALAAAIRPDGKGPALGTVSVAGPSVRMTDARVRELGPLVMRCASELASLWPLRGRSSAHQSTQGVIATAQAPTCHP